MTFPAKEPLVAPGISSFLVNEDHIKNARITFKSFVGTAEKLNCIFSVGINSE